MSGYTKLFSTLPLSTIWKEPNETRIVWITMLALANMDGTVDSSIPGLADLARVDLDKCEAALKTLMSPDKYSRTKTDEGRRIKEIDGGWLILNHAKYRDTLKNDPLGNADQRKGKIYFIKCDTLLKIGFSKNPWARLAALKTGMSGEVVFLGCVDGTLRDELELQKSLEKSRFNREWYNFTPEILKTLTSKGIATGSNVVATTKSGSSTEVLQYTASPSEAKADTEAKAGEDSRSFSETPSWKEFWEYCQGLHCGLAAEWYARDKWEAANSDRWAKKSDWRAYARRCKGWWQNDGSPMKPINHNDKNNSKPNPRNAGVVGDLAENSRKTAEFVQRQQEARRAKSESV